VPKAPLHSIGLLVRAARERRGLSQERAARAAGVSRQQWSRLEQGENVSVEFLDTVARSIGLAITIGDQRETAVSSSHVPSSHIDALLLLADGFTSLVNQLRLVAFEATVPLSARDAAAIATFISSRKDLSPDERTRLATEIERSIHGVDALRQDSVTAVADEARRKRPRRRRG
jgi:transcriptional regulator with XRE-family HTH domain